MGRKRLVNLAAVAIVVVVAWALKQNGIDINNLGQSGQNNQSNSSSKHKGSGGTTGQFDHYVLALSWSPTFCASNKGNQEQCAPDRDFAFIVHGLWPQYDKGGWPADCGGPKPEWVPDNVLSEMRDIMPSKKLIIHEWKKHGTCSGLGPAGYYDAVRAAYNNVNIPKQFQSLSKPLKVTPASVRDAFVKSNNGLDANEIGMTCDNRLREVRICMTKDLQFRQCGKQSGKCKAREMVMLPSR